MAEKICFIITENNKVVEEAISYTFIKGLAFSQRVKCALSLHNSIVRFFPNKRHLEISTKSQEDLGKQLSAFNLKIDKYFIESIFQSSKVFEGNIKFDFLISYSPNDAKKYIKNNKNGNLIKFNYMGIDYPLYPKTAFYDWIYINALEQNDLSKQLNDYDIFSDIEFNDKKSLNCQARAAAFYVAIVRSGKKDFYLSNFENFKLIYSDFREPSLSLF